MKVNDIITDAFSMGTPYPEPKSFNPTNYLDGATFLQQISEHLKLYFKEGYYSLVKDDEFVGFIKLSDVEIAGKTYSNVDLIHIQPKFRNGTAVKHLIYAVKEEAPQRVIADGAMFRGGEALINSIIRHNIMVVRSLDKNTGTVSPLNGLINDLDSCYIFEKTKLGYGNNHYISEYTWYPLFDQF